MINGKGLPYCQVHTETNLKGIFKKIQVLSVKTFLPGFTIVVTKKRVWFPTTTNHNTIIYFLAWCVLKERNTCHHTLYLAKEDFQIDTTNERCRRVPHILICHLPDITVCFVPSELNQWRETTIFPTIWVERAKCHMHTRLKTVISLPQIRTADQKVCDQCIHTRRHNIIIKFGLQGNQ